MRFILKKVIRKLYHLISFLTLMIIFIPNVKANDMFGGTINQDIFSPLRAMTDDSYGNYYIMPSNSAYLWYEPGPVSARTMRVFCFEGQDYLQDHVYAVTIYLTTNTANRVLPADAGAARRIGIGNSMNAARTAFVNNSAYSRSAIYTNYSYDYFDIRWPKTDGSFGLQHFVYSVTYFFIPNISGVGLAVPFQFNNSVSSSTTIYYAGYHLENLGLATNLSSSDIQNIINNSGLATASSQNEIKTSLNQVRQEITDLNNSIDDVNDSITSEDEPTIDLSDIDTASSTPISDLVTLPASLLNSYLSAFSGSCTSYTLPLPFNHSITLPCFTISDYVGSSVANIIDMAICLFMAYEIVLLFIRIFDDITTLSDTYTNWVKRGRY